MNPKKHAKTVNLSNARDPEQLRKMEEMAQNGICLFCKEGMEKYHDAPVIREKKWWYVTKNDYPYDGARIHMLIVYKDHIGSFEDISPAAMPELLEHLKWIKGEYRMRGGTFLMRFGDTKYTGASITHLHAHIVMGHKQKAGAEPIKQRIGYKK